MPGFWFSERVAAVGPGFQPVKELNMAEIRRKVSEPLDGADSFCSTPEAMELANEALPDQTFEPLGNLVVIKLLVQERSKGGVLIPEAQRKQIERNRPLDECPKGLVVAAGVQCKFVRRGDLVLVNGSWGMFKHRDVELRSAPEHQVVGIERSGLGGDRPPSFKVVSWETGEVSRFG